VPGKKPVLPGAGRFPDPEGGPDATGNRKEYASTRGFSSSKGGQGAGRILEKSPAGHLPPYCRDSTPGSAGVPPASLSLSFFKLGCALVSHAGSPQKAQESQNEFFDFVPIVAIPSEDRAAEFCKRLSLLNRQAPAGAGIPKVHLPLESGPILGYNGMRLST